MAVLLKFVGQDGICCYDYSSQSNILETEEGGGGICTVFSEDSMNTKIV